MLFFFAWRRPASETRANTHAYAQHFGLDGAAFNMAPARYSGASSPAQPKEPFRPTGAEMSSMLRRSYRVHMDLSPCSSQSQARGHDLLLPCSLASLHGALPLIHPLCSHAVHTRRVLRHACWLQQPPTSSALGYIQEVPVLDQSLVDDLPSHAHLVGSLHTSAGYFQV
ncbi:hypothetical protein LX36DRAFT_212058 [Colletotrichum falcatum]|nr:hypothetical protein LX36DRAFT_212058 [Colletotrichum falcatum]